MKARFALKAATAAEHERVDRLFSSLDLNREGDYRLFLRAQAAAHLPIEAALDRAGVEHFLPDWPARRRASLIEADLRELGTQAPDGIDPPALEHIPALLGAVYVLEGSRLGGALLQRSLPNGAPKRFLAAPQAPGSWRKLLETLDHFLYETSAVDSASETAREVFQRFEAGGLRFLESKVE